MSRAEEVFPRARPARHQGAVATLQTTETVPRGYIPGAEAACPRQALSWSHAGPRSGPCVARAACGVAGVPLRQAARGARHGPCSEHGARLGGGYFISADLSAKNTRARRAAWPAPHARAVKGHSQTRTLAPPPFDFGLVACCPRRPTRPQVPLGWGSPLPPLTQPDGCPIQTPPLSGEGRGGPPAKLPVTHCTVGASHEPSLTERHHQFTARLLLTRGNVKQA